MQMLYHMIGSVLCMFEIRGCAGTKLSARVSIWIFAGLACLINSGVMSTISSGQSIVETVSGMAISVHEWQFHRLRGLHVSMR